MVRLYICVLFFLIWRYYRDHTKLSMVINEEKREKKKHQKLIKIFMPKRGNVGIYQPYDASMSRKPKQIENFFFKYDLKVYVLRKPLN